MINISKATAIQGWMTEPELVWLAVQANKHKVIVEIGCFLGRSTRAMADNSAATIYAVDDFYGPHEADISSDERDMLYKFFIENMQGLKNVIPVVCDHRHITLDVKPDMVFIDGDHSYNYAKQDIEFWKSRLSIGGLLCGHDINLHEVYQAVSETLEFKIAPNTMIWYSIPR